MEEAPSEEEENKTTVIDDDLESRHTEGDASSSHQAEAEEVAHRGMG